MRKPFPPALRVIFSIGMNYVLGVVFAALLTPVLDDRVSARQIPLILFALGVFGFLVVAPAAMISGFAVGF